MPTLQERLRRVRDAFEQTTDPEVKRQLGAGLEQLLALREENPSKWFEPHSRPQLEFILSRSPVTAVFAGNQFGKSTALTMCAERECLPDELLPELLRSTRRYQPPVDGWILCPTEDKIYDSFQPAFEEWCPRAALKGGSWGKAFNGARMLLSFSNGSTIAFKTYKQDPSTLGGARLHFVAYDEPPPRKHREEARMRLVRYGGYEMFAMTPLDANTQYVRREIWKKREAPHITVVKGSIHDNPTLSAETVALALGDLTDIWRQAREFGDFVDVGGMIYPDFERCIASPDDPRLVDRDGQVTFNPDFVKTLDVVVGIDPGIRNAGFAWVGFDRDNVAYVFDEDLLQDKVPKDYAARIRDRNSRWGITRPLYVCDPAMRQRAQSNAETVMAELVKEGIYCLSGQNDHQAGFGQMRSRMQHGRFVVGPNCVGLRDEADDYAAKEPGENDDNSHLVPVNSQFHRLDALRYAVMERFWDPVVEQRAPDRNLGWSPASGTAPPKRLVLGRRGKDYGPLGSFT